MRWQNMSIEDFTLKMDRHDILATPADLMSFICSLQPPIRIFESWIWKPDWDGALLKVEFNGDPVLTVRLDDGKKEEIPINAKRILFLPKLE